MSVRACVQMRRGVPKGDFRMRRGGWFAVMALLVAHATALAATHVASGSEAGALADASMNGDLAAMDSLLKKRVDPNERGSFGTPPLHWRVRVDDLAAAKRLLKAGADPNGLTERGVSPLSLAIANGNPEMVALLLRAGADANRADPSGQTHLMMAAQAGVLAVVEQLL